MNVAPQLPYKAASEIRNCSVSFESKLDASELLTGTPTVEEIGSTDLTLTNATVSGAALTINQKTVAAGEAVQFRVAGGVAGKLYTIKITATSDASPAQTLIALVRLRCIADS